MKEKNADKEKDETGKQRRAKDEAEKRRIGETGKVTKTKRGIGEKVKRRKSQSEREKGGLKGKKETETKTKDENGDPIMPVGSRSSRLV